MLTSNHQDWREASIPPVMHSFLESREVKRERYTFMNSESHNGIYHAEDSVRYTSTDTTRDALDLRLGKADESSQYFAETNLLSDGPMESPLDALPSRSDVRSEHRDRSYDIEDVDRRLQAANQGTTSYEYPELGNQASEAVYHHDAQALKDDRKRRNRVVSEGAVSLAHTATSPLPVERSQRQRSVSMPHPMHNQRRHGGNTYHDPETSTYGDRDDLLVRSHSNKELDSNILELRDAGLHEMSAHSSTKRYIQANPRLHLDFFCKFLHLVSVLHHQSKFNYLLVLEIL